MADENDDKFEQLIAQEKRAYARESFGEFWSNSVADGVEAEVLAETVIEAALNELSHTQGSREASRLISQFKKMDELGLFPAGKTMQ